MPWTLFHDMHSGGRSKEPPFEKIYIEAPADEACIIFYNRFGHSPHRVTCTCCGRDYSVSESDTLAGVSAYERGCPMHKDGSGYDLTKTGTGMYGRQIIPVEQYVRQANVKVIPAEEITPDERVGDVPEQGYVWVG